MAAGVRGNANIMKAITWARAIVARGPSMRDTARILGPGASPTAALGSCRCWGRLANRVHDPGSVRARHSDVVSLPATIQLTAPLVLSDEGHQGIEHVRHGARRLPQLAGDGWAPERNPEGLIVVEGDVIRIVQRYGLATRQEPSATASPAPQIGSCERWR